MVANDPLPTVCVGAVVATCSILQACAPPLQAPPQDPWIEHADYAFATSWEGAVHDAGWVFTTDHGWTYRIESWTLRTTSMEVVPCPEAELWWASLWWGGSAAYAHGVYDHDVSVIEGDWSEDLADDATWSIGGTAFPREHYCDAFHVHAIQEDGQSVARIVGQYLAPGARSWTFFDAATPYPATGVPQLGVGAWDASLPPSTAHVTLVRHPVRSFQGLEPDGLSPEELAYTLLFELARTTTIEWSLGPVALE